MNKKIKIALASAGLLATVVTSGTVGYSISQVEVNDLQAQQTELKKENKKLKSTVTLRNSEIGELKKSNASLESDVFTLFEENQSLKQGLGSMDNAAIEDIFRAACNLYGVDYKLALAIAKLETGNFTSDVYINKHNVGGLTNGGEYKTFSSVTEGVFEMVRNLKVNYINKGLTTPSEINPKYCPTDSNWASKVTQIMESL